jgi:hypothetical protein
VYEIKDSHPDILKKRFPNTSDHLSRDWYGFTINGNIVSTNTVLIGIYFENHEMDAMKEKYRDDIHWIILEGAKMMRIDPTALDVNAHLHQIVAVGFISILTSDEWERLKDVFTDDVEVLQLLRMKIRFDVYFAIRRYAGKKFIASLYQGSDDKMIELCCQFDALLKTDYNTAMNSLSVEMLEGTQDLSFPDEQMSEQFNLVVDAEKTEHYTSMMHAIACTWILNIYYPSTAGKYDVTGQLIVMEPNCTPYVRSILANYTQIERNASIFAGVIIKHVKKHHHVYVEVASVA